MAKRGPQPWSFRHQVELSVSTAKAITSIFRNLADRFMACNELQINIFFHQQPNEFIYLKGFSRK